MYFIIPASYIGVGNPATSRTIYLDNGTSLEYKPTTLKYSFGEGYSLTLPTGPEKRTFSASMSNRPKAEVNAIKDYFTFLKGNKINNFIILDTLANIKTISFSVVWVNLDTGTVQANFEEVLGA